MLGLNGLAIVVFGFSCKIVGDFQTRLKVDKFAHFIGNGHVVVEQIVPWLFEKGMKVVGIEFKKRTFSVC